MYRFGKERCTHGLYVCSAHAVLQSQRFVTGSYSASQGSITTKVAYANMYRKIHIGAIWQEIDTLRGTAIGHWHDLDGMRPPFSGDADTAVTLMPNQRRQLVEGLKQLWINSPHVMVPQVRQPDRAMPGTDGIAAITRPLPHHFIHFRVDF